MSIRPVLLVHGAWSGSWCWTRLQSELDRLGVPSHSIDLPGHGASPLPLGDLEGDARAVADAVDALGPEVTLIGHSYGGAVITRAAALTSVSHLIYIAAFALEDGESVNGFLRAAPRHRVELADAIRPAEDGTTTLDPDVIGPIFYPTLDPTERAALTARHSPQPNAAMTQAVTGNPRPTTPSTYVLCNRDRTVHPEHQRIMAERCDTTIELARDHYPFIEDPSESAGIIARISAG
jgi:pimeloyl-ACP methyl ester carboxylesterase